MSSTCRASCRGNCRQSKPKAVSRHTEVKQSTERESSVASQTIKENVEKCDSEFKVKPEQCPNSKECLKESEQSSTQQKTSPQKSLSEHLSEGEPRRKSSLASSLNKSKEAMSGAPGKSVCSASCKGACNKGGPQSIAGGESKPSPPKKVGFSCGCKSCLCDVCDDGMVAPKKTQTAATAIPEEEATFCRASRV